MTRLDPRLAIVFSAMLFSTGGAAVKASSMTGWQIAGLRSGVAFLALLLFVPAVRRGWHWRIVPVSIAYAAMLTLFVLANKLTTAGSTIFLQSTAPLYLLFLAPWLLRERIHKDDLWFMLALAIGLAMFFVATDAPTVTAPRPLLGNILGALAGVSWALTLLGLRWLARHPGAGTASTAAAVGNLFAFAIAAFWTFPIESSTPSDWLIIAYLGVIQIGLAYAILTAAIDRVPAFEVSLLILVEPVLSPVWAWLIHGERVGRFALAGGAVILLATFVRTFQQRRRSDDG